MLTQWFGWARGGWRNSGVERRQDGIQLPRVDVSLNLNGEHDGLHALNVHVHGCLPSGHPPKVVLDPRHGSAKFGQLTRVAVNGCVSGSFPFFEPFDASFKFIDQLFHRLLLAGGPVR